MELTKLKLIITMNLIGVVLCAPQRRQSFGSPQQQVPILSYENNVNYDGTYRWRYEAGNGIAAEEQGQVKNRGNPQLEAEVAQGQYSYTSPEGYLIRLSYIADENGFRAQGDHLPTPPPIPPEIQRSLDFIRSQPPQNEPPRSNRFG